MTRKLFNLVCILSLLLAPTMLVVWFHTYQNLYKLRLTRTATSPAPSPTTITLQTTLYDIGATRGQFFVHAQKDVAPCDRTYFDHVLRNSPEYSGRWHAVYSTDMPREVPMALAYTPLSTSSALGVQWGAWHGSPWPLVPNNWRDEWHLAVPIWLAFLLTSLLLASRVFALLKSPNVRRRLFTSLSALSFALCALVLVIWARGYRTCDWLHLTVNLESEWHLSTKTSRGAAALEIIDYGENYQPRSYHFEHQCDDPIDLRPAPDPMWTGRIYCNRWGFVATREVGAQLEESLRMQSPLWPMALLWALCPIAWLLTRSRRGSPPGHCTACSYNLTGNTSGICPECGHRFSQSCGTR